MNRFSAIRTLVQMNGWRELIPWLLAHLTGTQKYAQEAEEALVASLPRASEPEHVQEMFDVLGLRLCSLGFDGKNRCHKLRRKLMWETRK